MKDRRAGGNTEQKSEVRSQRSEKTKLKNENKDKDKTEIGDFNEIKRDPHLIYCPQCGGVMAGINSCSYRCSVCGWLEDMCSV